MSAFVQSTGLGVTRSPLPQSGLDSVCSTNRNSTPATNAVSKKPQTVRMVSPADFEITLQTLIYNPTPVVSGVEDKDLICYNVWKQVFGNAYVMDSERAEGYVSESMFRAGQISLKEFVRGVAKTDTYKRRFFDCCGPYRAVELNFKHLLGRGPNSQQEVSEHIRRIANEGFEAEIDSYIDSAEYEESFGQDFVPYMRFKGTYPTIEEFTNMCAMYSYPGTTDKSLSTRARMTGIDNPNHVLSLDGAGVSPKLVSSLAMNTSVSFLSVKKAIPSRPDLEFGLSTIPSDTIINEKAASVSRYEVVPGSYMYLTDEEISEYEKGAAEQGKVLSLAETEIAEAKLQIDMLQSKIAELELIN